MAGRKRIGLHGWWAIGMSFVIMLTLVPPVVDEYRVHLLEKEHAFSSYMEVQRVSVGNSTEGEHVVIDVERSIHKAFRGAYHVEVRTFPRREVVCVASDELMYTPTASLPPLITLEWWADDRSCSGTELPAGDYILVTTWSILDLPREVSPKTLTVESNQFSVEPVEVERLGDTVEEQQRLQERVEQLQSAVRRLQLRELMSRGQGEDL